MRKEGGLCLGLGGKLVDGPWSMVHGIDLIDELMPITWCMNLHRICF